MKMCKSKSELFLTGGIYLSKTQTGQKTQFMGIGFRKIFSSVTYIK